jgi:lysophospholipase L1-like esterase
MEDAGIATDDLHTFTAPRLEKIQQPQNVHFSEEGYRVIASQVASAIRSGLRSNR